MTPEAPITTAAVQAAVNLNKVLDVIPAFAAPDVHDAVKCARLVCLYAVRENRENVTHYPNDPPPTAGEDATMEQHAAAADKFLAEFMDLLPPWADIQTVQNGRTALAILLGDRRTLPQTMRDRHTVAMEYIAAAEVVKHLEADLEYQRREGYPKTFNEVLKENPEDEVALVWKRENTEQCEALDRAKTFLRRYRQPPTSA